MCTWTRLQLQVPEVKGPEKLCTEMGPAAGLLLAQKDIGQCLCGTGGTRPVVGAMGIVGGKGGVEQE